MASLLNMSALLFRATAAGATTDQCGKVLAADSSKQTATVEMTCLPKSIRFECEGNPKGLSEGDYFQFHLEKDAVKWKGGEMKITKVLFILE